MSGTQQSTPPVRGGQSSRASQPGRLSRLDRPSRPGRPRQSGRQPVAGGGGAVRRTAPEPPNHTSAVYVELVVAPLGFAGALYSAAVMRRRGDG